MSADNNVRGVTSGIRVCGDEIPVGTRIVIMVRPARSSTHETVVGEWLERSAEMSHTMFVLIQSNPDNSNFLSTGFVERFFYWMQSKTHA